MRDVLQNYEFVQRVSLFVSGFKMSKPLFCVKICHFLIMNDNGNLI